LHAETASTDNSVKAWNTAPRMDLFLPHPWRDG
jgi:hypothetical protein